MSLKKIAIANQKGGVGKTTSTMEIAAILSSLKRRVLVIDLDQQCNLTTDLGADPEKPTIYELFKEEQPNIEEAIQKVHDGFDLIAGSSALSRADTEFKDLPDIELLGDLMDALSDTYDYIIVDNGPARNNLLNMSYLAADYFIMCVDSGEDSIKGVEAIVSDMMKYHKPGKKALSEAKILGFIVSRFRNTSIANSLIQVLADKVDTEIPQVIKTDEKPFIMTVREAAVVDESKVFHQCLQSYKKYSNPAIDYRRIVDEIIKKVE